MAGTQTEDDETTEKESLDATMIAREMMDGAGSEAMRTRVIFSMTFRGQQRRPKQERRIIMMQPPQLKVGLKRMTKKNRTCELFI